MARSRRYAISYGSLLSPLKVLGMGPSSSGAELGDNCLTVHMGWAFGAKIPLASVTGAARREQPVMSIGVHGWRGRWLVNGTTTGIVSLDISPTVRAHMMGIPVHLHQLLISLEDPDGFLAELTARRDAGQAG